MKYEYRKRHVSGRLSCWRTRLRKRIVPPPTVMIVPPPIAAFILLCALLCSAAGCSEDDSTCPADIEAPRVESTYPVEGDTLVPPDTLVTVTFDEIMDPATISAGTFTLEGPRGAVAATVTYHGSTAKLTPYEPLAGHSLYTARIDGGVTDFEGNRMGVPYAWSFTTGTTFLLLSPGIEYTIRDTDGDGEPDELAGGGPPGRLLMAGDAGVQEDRAVMEFPLGDIVHDTVLEALVLITFTESTLPSAPGDIEGWGFSGDGDGNLSDWNAGALIRTLEDTDLGAGTTIAFPMTDAINAALASGATHVGFRIVVTGGAQVEIATTTGTMPQWASRISLIY